MTNRSDHKGSSYNAAKQALQLLTSAFQAQLAGGCVRDRLLGIEPADYDIATTALPDDVTALFQSHGYKVIPTGIDHGTVTVLINRIPLEITTLRKDVATDGRRATVAFGASFYEDAARRDFTINAMYEDIDGNITDFFSGQQHLQEGKLVFVGDPNARIQEDYLRILRFFRFAGRFSFDLQPEALRAISRHKQGLSFVSQERIVYELSQILGNGNPEVVYAMHQVGVLQVLFKDVPVNQSLLSRSTDVWGRIWHASTALPKIWRVASRLEALLAPQELLSTDSASLKHSLRSMRFPTDVLQASTYCRELRAKLSNNNLSETDCVWILKALNDKGIAPTMLTVQALLDKNIHPQVQRCQNVWSRIHERFSGEIPLNGDDIRQSSPDLSGKELGETLKALQTAYYLHEWTTRDQGMTWLKQNKT